MKKLTYFLLPIVVMLLTGCQPKYENVATTFTNLYMHGNVDEAQKYVTEESKEAMNNGLGNLLLVLLYRDNEDFQAKILSHEQNGDVATVNIIDANKKDSEVFPIVLVKKDGKWLVDFIATNKEAEGESVAPQENLLDKVADKAEEVKDKIKDEADQQIDKAKAKVEKVENEVKQGVKKIEDKVEKAKN